MLIVSAVSAQPNRKAQVQDEHDQQNSSSEA
jgi:hypothetical protein